MRRPACFYGRCQNEEGRLILKVILERMDHRGYSASFKEKEIVFLATLCLFPFSCLQFY
jgi:hypothetical protein